HDRGDWPVVAVVGVVVRLRIPPPARVVPAPEARVPPRAPEAPAARAPPEAAGGAPVVAAPRIVHPGRVETVAAPERATAHSADQAARDADACLEPATGGLRGHEDLPRLRAVRVRTTDIAPVRDLGGRDLARALGPADPGGSRRARTSLADLRRPIGS